MKKITGSILFHHDYEGLNRYDIDTGQDLLSEEDYCKREGQEGKYHRDADSW